jgi:hydroxyacylglutathione hydrolase
MNIRTAAAPPIFKNGYVVWHAGEREAILIDPGDEVTELLDVIAREALTVKYILLTHAHFDHVSGVGRAKAALGAPVWLQREDLFLYEAAPQQAALFGLRVDALPPVDAFYAPGQQFAVGSLVVDVLPTPGHCPGGVCLAVGVNGSATRELFVGDTLFAGSVGRTDLPGGDHDLLIRSITDVLFPFPDDTVVHSGHGPATTIGAERRTNPFLA